MTGFKKTPTKTPTRTSCHRHRVAIVSACVASAFAVALGCQSVTGHDSESDAADSSLSARHTIWTVNPTPATIGDGGKGIFDAWEAARSLVGPSQTVSLFGDELDDFWNAPFQFLIAEHDLNVFPQIAFNNAQLPTEDDHIDLARNLAEIFQPRWINICVECNNWLGDVDFIDQLDRVRLAVLEASPQTKVCLSIQYEHSIIWQNTTEVVQAWSAADGVGISTYPQVLQKDVPTLDFYAPFFNALDGRPMIVCETGWGVTEPMDLIRQADHIRLMQSFDAPIVNYYYLSDDTAGSDPFFGEMGLMNETGQTRPAYDVFKRIAHSPEEPHQDTNETIVRNETSTEIDVGQ
jgi:hypothetical protein